MFSEFNTHTEARTETLPRAKAHGMQKKAEIQAIDEEESSDEGKSYFLN